MPDLTLRTERRDGRILVWIGGELDLGTVGRLEQAVSAELAADRPSEVVLDLAGVSFVDSSGLGAMLRIRAAVQGSGGRLTLTGVGPGPARVISIAGLSGTFGLPES